MLINFTIHNIKEAVKHAGAHTSVHTEAREMERLFCQLLSLALLTQLALSTPAPESTVTPKGGTTEGSTSLTGTDQLSNKIVTLEEKLSTLQTRLDTLTSQITSPVNLYQGCVQETRTCSITGGDGTSSYRECSTSGMAIEVSHFSMQCMAKYL